MYFVIKSYRRHGHLIPILFVLLVGLIPAVTRIDRFPLSTHPMFSESLSRESVEAFQVFFRNLKGDEVQVPIFCHKLAIYLLNRNLMEKNWNLVELTMRAVVLNNIDLNQPGTLILYRVKSLPGGDNTIVKKEHEMRLSGV